MKKQTYKTDTLKVWKAVGNRYWYAENLKTGEIVAYPGLLDLQDVIELAEKFVNENYED